MRVLGINDERDFCECCGKSGLKRVVWIEKDGGDITHVGVVCATKKHLFMTEAKIMDAIMDEKYKADKEHEGTSEYLTYQYKVKEIHEKFKDLPIRERVAMINVYSKISDQKKAEIYKRRNIK